MRLRRHKNQNVKTYQIMKKINAVHSIILPMFLAGLFSCSLDSDEEFTTRVSGTVVNRYTQEPIEGAYIYLKDGVGTSGVVIVDSETSSDKRSEMYTNADGAFALELTGKYSVYLGVGKEGYREFIDQSTSAGIKSYGRNGGSFESQIIELEARAGFNPIFESTVPVSPTDSLAIIFQGTRTDLPASQLKNGWNIGWNRLYVGQQASRFITTTTLDELVVLTSGDTYAEYQIAYTRNGQWQTKIDSVYIKAFETYTDTIYY